jgi:hypothetical protein
LQFGAHMSIVVLFSVVEISPLNWNLRGVLELPVASACSGSQQ